MLSNLFAIMSFKQYAIKSIVMRAIWLTILKNNRLVEWKHGPAFSYEIADFQVYDQVSLPFPKSFFFVFIKFTMK